MGKEYVFDGPDGKVTLAGLFGRNSQLIVYHFMFAPGWKVGCPHCSFWCDPLRWRHGSPEPAGHHTRRHLARPMEGNLAVQKADGLEVQLALLVQKRFQL
jgi:hypothetical protein